MTREEKLPPEGQNCSACFFYLTRVVGELTVGECRYEPPRLQPGGHQGVWPQVLAGDWCGRWEITK